MTLQCVFGDTNLQIGVSGASVRSFQAKICCGDHQEVQTAEMGISCSCNSRNFSSLRQGFFKASKDSFSTAACTAHTRHCRFPLCASLGARAFLSELIRENDSDRYAYIATWNKHKVTYVHISRYTCNKRKATHIPIQLRGAIAAS